MTTSNLMSLPVDIPWRLLATSEDMIATDPLPVHPPKWRSSVSVFFYEPPREQQQFADRTITYLKITCSITGMQMPHDDANKEIGSPPGYLAAYPYHKDPVNKYWLASYYPCHGALLQVKVLPEPTDLPRDSYPIILDLEPKKRELYFSASEGREVLSSSQSTVGVNKSTTNTHGTETRTNIGGGLQISGDTVGGGLNLGLSTSTTSTASQQQVITTDLSRERRETLSYNTQLSHLYHLLDSYHIGTNRAIFLLHPRPYDKGTGEDQHIALVNGPRRLEGIQEFFLIIDRPSAVHGLCVYATLETCHLAVRNVYEGALIFQSERELYPDRRTATDLGLSGNEIDAALESIASNWNKAKNKQQIVNQLLVGGPEDYATAKTQWETTRAEDENKWGSTTMPPWTISESDWGAVLAVTKYIPVAQLASPLFGGAGGGTADLVVLYRGSEVYTGSMFLAGRTTGACYQEMQECYLVGASLQGLVPSLVFEGVIPLIGARHASLSAMTIDAANEMSGFIRQGLTESIGAAGRFPYGRLRCDQADFVQRRLAAALTCMRDDDPYNVPLRAIEGLSAHDCERLETLFGVATRREALAIDGARLRVALDVDEVKLRDLLSALIGKGPNREQVAAGFRKTEVPPIVGTSLRAAKGALLHAGLKLDSHWEHNEVLGAADQVLEQHPVAGTPATVGDVVRVVISRGACRVPDVVGMDAEDAAHVIREAGLQPRLVMVEGEEDRLWGTVIGMVPQPGAQCLSTTPVVLVVVGTAGGGPTCSAGDSSK